MSERRKFFYKTIGRWWAMCAADYNWSAPDTPEIEKAGAVLWALKERYEAGEIKLSECKPAFDRWAQAHQAANGKERELVRAYRASSNASI